jgi:hypothetical protein
MRKPSQSFRKAKMLIKRRTEGQKPRRAKPCAHFTNVKLFFDNKT